MAHRFRLSLRIRWGAGPPGSGKRVLADTTGAADLDARDVAAGHEDVQRAARPMPSRAAASGTRSKSGSDGIGHLAVSWYPSGYMLVS